MALLLAACADWARSLTPTPGFVHGRSSSTAAGAVVSLLAVAEEAVVLIDVEVGALVDLDVVVDAVLEVVVADAATGRRVRVVVGFVAEAAGSRVVVLTVLETALEVDDEAVLDGALALVAADVLVAEATRFFGCGSGSDTCSTRSSVAARSSSEEADAAAVRRVVRVATLVEGGAATRAGMVVAGGCRCCCCFGRKQLSFQGHQSHSRSVWRTSMVATCKMTRVKFRLYQNSVMNSCPSACCCG